MEGNLFVEERRANIIKAIKAEGKIWVKDLSGRFDVSEVTIRQDLNELEKLGLVKRTYGGAIEVSNSLSVSPFTERVSKRMEQKCAIAKAALQFVEDGDSLMFDCGTTVLELTNLIRLRNDLHLTIVANFIPHISALEESENIDLVVLGGNYERTERRMGGPLAIKALSTMFVDKVFISTNGVNPKTGVTSTTLSEAELRSMMVDHGKMRILLADSSKIGRSNLVSACPIEKIDIIITDWEITDEECKEFEAKGVEVIIANRI